MKRALPVALLAACTHSAEPPDAPPPKVVADTDVALLEDAPPASPRVDPPAAFRALQERIEARWGGDPNRRAALILDKPIYRPGETVWFTALDLDLPTLAPRTDRAQAHVVLVDPRGATAEELYPAQDAGRAASAFDLPPDAPGGRWLVRVVRGDEILVERPVMVQAYEAPRLKKELDFLRDAYGPGDEVTATVTVARATGEPLADAALEGRIRIDGAELQPVTVRTDDQGRALLRFTVPADTTVGDGTLTVRVPDGGLVEGSTGASPS
ncbi:MAG: MG2 domain-containing protein [Myxococcota bacterium]